MRLGVLTTCIVLSAVCAAASAQETAAFVELGPAQIRTLLSGKYVTDDFHWAHHYLPDGRLTRVEKGRVKPGRWTVRDKRLCLTVSERGPEPECFTVHRQGDELQYRDERGRVVWSGSVRNKAGAHLFDGVVDPPPTH